MLKPDCKPERSVLRAAVAGGVPRARRGEAWHLLASLSRAPAPSQQQFPALVQVIFSSVPLQPPVPHQPYNSLKCQLTSHQHAILIDLGRTFPSHPYFSGALGPGQLGLFNILKAYRCFLDLCV